MCICVYLILAVHNVTVHVERDRISFRAAAVIWPHKSGERERERERERDARWFYGIWHIQWYVRKVC